jgi:hypothetical protein
MVSVNLTTARWPSSGNNNLLAVKLLSTALCPQPSTTPGLSVSFTALNWMVGSSR